MTILEAIYRRHSVRSYTDEKIPERTITSIREEIANCNKESGLNIQLVIDDPKAFEGMMAHYGNFKNVHNYIALIGRKESSLEERVGYYGEHLVLLAQLLGLNTCWVAMTFTKKEVKTRCRIADDERLVCVIALGYGTVQGSEHRSKPLNKLCKVDGPMPEWFKKGMEAAMQAPTAINQQKFLFTLANGKVTVKSLGGFYSNIDLGIVNYHFELGSGRKL